jgi:hypothetical protein
LSAVQSLGLALLVSAKHDGMFRWVETKPADGFQFLGELGEVDPIVWTEFYLSLDGEAG